MNQAIADALQEVLGGYQDNPDHQDNPNCSSEQPPKRPRLIQNAIKCPDGKIIESRHRHNFVEHRQDDGRLYFVDGGLDYQRIGCADETFTDLSIYNNTPHDVLRERFLWTSCLDADGNDIEPVRRVLKDLTDTHIIALVKWTKDSYPLQIRNIMEAEASFRGLINE